MRQVFIKYSCDNDLSQRYKHYFFTIAFQHSNSRIYGGDSNDVTCAVVRVLCIPLHAKACCRSSTSTVVFCLGRQQNLRLSIICDSDDSSVLHVMVYKVLGRQHRQHHLNHPRRICIFKYTGSDMGIENIRACL